jgi:hypothetical protein
VAYPLTKCQAPWVCWLKLLWSEQRVGQNEACGAQLAGQAAAKRLHRLPSGCVVSHQLTIACCRCSAGLHVCACCASVTNTSEARVVLGPTVVDHGR